MDKPTQKSSARALINGRILTQDASSNICEALYWRDGRIEAVGRSADVLSQAGANADVINAGGRAVIPGFIDAHAHMDREGLKSQMPDFAGAHSLSDVYEVISALVAEAAPGEWIVTMPIGEAPFYDDPRQNLLERRLPDRHALDRIAPANPVYIRAAWGWWHGRPPLVSVANSLALEKMAMRAPIDDFHPLIIFEVDSSGEYTGRIIEQTFVPVVELTHLPRETRFTHAQRVAALRSSMRVYNSFGTTGVFEGHGVAQEVEDVYRALDEDNNLTVRVHLTRSLPWNRMTCPRLRQIQSAEERVASSFLRMEGFAVQLGIDELDALRAKEHPYTGWAGFYYDSGLASGELSSLLFELADAGQRPVSIGANALPLYSEVARQRAVSGRRWVIGHVGALSGHDIAQLAAMNACITTHTNRFIYRQGCEFAGTPCGAATARRGMVPRSAVELVPLRSLMNASIVCALGSDNTPVSMFYPIWEAVARKCQNCGTPIGAAEAITRQQALHAATMGGAYVCGDEKSRGSIEPGKLADLAVLSADPLTVSEDSLRNIVSELTIVGGNTVYCRDPAAFPTSQQHP
jgi:predicted amidohydrolase YtcJ